MKILKIALDELVGMFVDDGALALAAFILVVLVAGLVKLAGLNGLAAALILLIGCIAIVTESISRAARKRFRPKR